MAEARAYVLSHTPVTAFNRTSTARAIVEAVIGRIAEHQHQLANIVNGSFLSTAAGDDLDRIGELVGVYRRSSMRAADTSNSAVRFLIDPYSNNTAADIRNKVSDTSNTDIFPATGGIVIPKGVAISNGGSKVYTTTTDAKFSSSDKEAYVSVIADGIGSSYNVGIGELNTHDIAQSVPELVEVASYFLVENSSPITMGADAEDDESLRYRIAHAVTAAAAANRDSIRQAIMSVPGIADLKFVNRAAAYSVIYVRSTDGVVSLGELHAVQAAVDQVKAIGETITIKRPDYRTPMFRINVYFEPQTKDRDAIIGRIRNGIVDYINNLSFGGEIVYNQLVEIAMTEPGVRDVTIEPNPVPVYEWLPDKHKTGKLYGSFTFSSGSNLRAGPNEEWYVHQSLLSVCTP